MPNRNLRIQKDTLAENIFAECNEDFILPDYMPEIRRVLRLESRLVKGEHFIGNGKADFEGSVLYTLFYTDDGEKLTAVPLESHYEYHVPIGAELPQLIYTQETAESVNMRPSGPRRINIRTKIRASVHTAVEAPVQKIPEELLPEGSGAAEFLIKEKDVLRTAVCRSAMAEALAEFKEEGTEQNDLHILYGGADIFCENARAEDGHVICRGAVCIKLLLEKSGSEILTLTKHIPFEEEITAEGCQSGDAVTACGVCHSLEIESGEEDGGTMISAVAHFSIEAIARRNERIQTVTDMYATEKELDVSYMPLRTEYFVGSFMGSFSVDGESETEDDEIVLLTSLTVRTHEVSLFEKRATVTGEVRADLLCQKEAAEQERFRSADFTFPFRLEAELPAVTEENDKITVTLTPLSAETAVQNGKRHTSAELALCLSVTRESEIALPDAVTAKERKRPDAEEEVTVYYPTDKDSLWSIGKRYGMPTELLQKQNGILKDEDTALDSTKSLDGIAWVFASGL